MPHNCKVDLDKTCEYCKGIGHFKPFCWNYLKHLRETITKQEGAKKQAHSAELDESTVERLTSQLLSESAQRQRAQAVQPVQVPEPVSSADTTPIRVTMKPRSLGKPN